MITKQEVDDALFNLGRLTGKLNVDDGKRMYMMVNILSGYIKQLEARDEPFDLDGRC